MKVSQLLNRAFEWYCISAARTYGYDPEQDMPGRAADSDVMAPAQTRL